MVEIKKNKKVWGNGLVKMKKVLVFGTFDLFHPGHDFFLKKAKEYGDILEVVVARDETVKEIKKEYPLNDEIKRFENVKELDYVDNVYFGSEGEDKYKIIEELKPDVICLGYDQYSFTEGLKEILNERGLNPKIVKIRGFKINEYKSSIIRSKMS